MHPIPPASPVPIGFNPLAYVIIARMPSVVVPSRDDLSSAFCLESVDRISGDPATSAFKAAARLHQSRWRQAQGHPIGTHPTKGDSGARPIGSRIPLEHAKQTYANFIDSRCAQAVRSRIDNPQKHQMLNTDRLYADLLSSMPMCFNLFGTLTEPERATQAIRCWWPDTPGRVERVVFEWSPGRCDRSYLGNRTSFDVAFILELEHGRRGVIGIETKYHEHPTPVEIAPTGLARYLEVARTSELFSESALGLLPDHPGSQLWLDHLLVLSMLQHESRHWAWVRFIVVYPDANPSWPPLIKLYESLLADRQTFVSHTFDELIAGGALEASVCTALNARYRCW